VAQHEKILNFFMIPRNYVAVRPRSFVRRFAQNAVSGGGRRFVNRLRQLHQYGRVAKNVYDGAKGGYNRVKFIFKKPRNKTKAVNHSSFNKNSLYIKRGNLALGKKQSTLGKWRYEQTHSGIITSTAGNQTATDICSLNTCYQMITSTGAAYNDQQNYTAIKDLNPYQATTGSAYVVGGVVPLEDRFVVNDNHVSIEFTNFSGMGAVIDIYVCTPKIPQADRPKEVWAAGYANEALGHAIMTAPVAGFSGTEVVGYGARTLVGATPQSVPYFNKLWKVAAHRQVTIAGAATHVQHIHVAMQKVIKVDVNRAHQTAGDGFIPNQTYHIFTVARGQIVEDHTGGAHLPTFGSVRVGYIAQSRTKACAVKGNSARLNNQAIAYNIPVGTTLANQVFIDDEDQIENAGTTTIT